MKHGGHTTLRCNILAFGSCRFSLNYSDMVNSFLTIPAFRIGPHDMKALTEFRDHCSPLRNAASEQQYIYKPVVHKQELKFLLANT